MGTKLPNAFGLHDMHGNVREWCEDFWHSSYAGAPADGSAWVSPSGSGRVRRGGDWFNFARYCRSAYRYNFFPSFRGSLFGFRLASVR